MSRISLAEVVEKQYLYCPRCHQSLSLLSKDEIQELRCDGCGSNYPVAGGIPLLVPDGDGKTAEIQEFWGALYDDAYREHDENASSNEFNTLLDKLRELFTHRRHLAAVEMSPDQLKGKKILEVGCGAGAHSALFSRSP